MDKSTHLKDRIIEEYWMKKWSQDLPRELLPVSKSKSNYQPGARRETLERVIPRETIRQLDQMSKGSELGRFILFLTALSGLLHRYSQSEDICIGTTTLVQAQSELGSLLFLKPRVQGSRTWRELNEDMKAEFSRTLNHQANSLSLLYDKWTSLHGRELQELWQLACVDEGLQTAVDDLDRFDLIIKLVPNEEEGRILQLVYRPEVYSLSLLESFAANLLYVLEQWPKKSAVSLEDDAANMLAPQQRELLVKGLNQTAVELTDVNMLHQLFEEQVVQTPEQAAVVEAEYCISYRELNARANQLARALQRHGVGPDDIVGIMTEPTVEIIVAILAVLKAGGAYCPIDPAFPAERVQQLFTDSRMELLISPSQYVDTHPFQGTVLDLSNPAFYTGETSNLPVQGRPDHMAYVIYTSGSTGTPKGVMIEHRHIVNQLAGLKHSYDFHEQLRHILMAPFTFDPSVQQIFLPLATGGTLYLVPKEAKNDPSAFWGLVRKERINVLNTVPSLMEVLLEQAPDIEHPFAFIIMAGEVCSGQLVQQLRDKLNIDKLFNIYGPTEAAINTTLYECQPVEQRATLPIGKPLLNYQVYVLDPRQRLLPFGAIGELFIAGAGLARGYLYNPRLTDERFVPNPFGTQTERMYKTGDLVRWLPDDNLEFIGRSDDQVKIRGMRVELGEIESLLRSHPSIKEAVVIPHGSGEHTEELATFYTLKRLKTSKASPLGTNDIQLYLKQYVPDYMVPAHVVCLESMPVTANGKVDKKALPLHRIGVVHTRAYVAPRNELEEQLADIWKKLLSVPAVSVEDSFFEAGGNSLSIVRLQSRIHHLLKTQLTIPQLFTHHTIAMQAQIIQSGGVEKPIKPLREMDTRRQHIHRAELGAKGRHGDVAVIGMACRFPMADSCDAFWDNLCREVDAVRDIPTHRLQDIVHGSDNVAGQLGSLPQGAYLEQIDGFDASFFHIAPNEARMMDPQQRLLLQVVWEAMMNAGYSEKEVYGSKTGVFVGTGTPQYLDLMPQIEPSAIPGNLQAVIAGRIAYVFNWTGPAEVINTACSSSLMAVHHAVQEITSGSCEMAVAGGVNLYLSMVDENLFNMGIAAPDGKTKAYDASADGTGGGEGVGAVVLKSLEQAVADGDYIYAVIKGSAANSDGRSNGMTAPNAAAQADVIEEAWKRAGIDPETISYIETHGTGTKLGDPIEMEGIARAFGRYTNRKQFCAVGSVKSNIGHLDSAAGIAGFMKAVLAMTKRQIPASLHFKVPNPHIDFVNSPVYVAPSLQEWMPECGIRRAGVSSFGLSGTNCHVVLEEYTLQREAPPPGEEYLFTLSARTGQALYAYAERFAAYLGNNHEALADICYCTNISRGNDAYRLATVVSSQEELQRKLKLFAEQGDQNAASILLDRERIYVNTIGKTGGNPAPYRVQPAESLERLVEAYMQGSELEWDDYYRGQNRVRVPLPGYPFEEKRYWVEPKIQQSPDVPASAELIADTQKGAPDFWQATEMVFQFGERLLEESGFAVVQGYKEAVDEFATQLIIELFRQWGTLTEPGKVYKESEMLHTIGITSTYQRLFRFMLRFVEKQGYVRLDGENIMLTVDQSVPDLSVLCTQYIEQYPAFAGTFKVLKYCLDAYPAVLTGKRSPLSVLFPDGTSQFLAGFANQGRTLGDLCETMALDALKQHILAQAGKRLRILEVGAGSGTVGKVLFPAIAGLQVEYCYTDLGRGIILEAQKQFAAYPFVQYQTFNIEEDPLAQGFVPEQFDIIIGLNVIHATSRLRTSLSQLKKVLAPGGALFMIEKVQNEPAENLIWGMTEGWWLFEDQDIRKDSPLVPTETWEQLLKEEQFTEVRTFPVRLPNRTKAETALIIGRMSEQAQVSTIEDLMYRVRWTPKELKKTREGALVQGNWLIFKDKLGIGDELALRLTHADHQVVTVEMGQMFEKQSHHQYTIRAGVEADYLQLMSELRQRNQRLNGIVHLWTCTDPPSTPVNIETVDVALESGVYSLYFLTKALLHQGLHETLDLRVVSNFTQRISDEQYISPEKSAIHGLVKVISQEHPQLQCFGLDVDTIHHTREQVADLIMTELQENKTDSFVVIRQERYIQGMARLESDMVSTPDTRNHPNIPARRSVTIRPGAVYIVTGGAGGLGLEVCRYLSQQAPIHLVILNRTELPEKEHWSQIIHDPVERQADAATYRKLSAFVDMEKHGSQVHYYAGDVSDFRQVQLIFEDVQDRFGPIKGVVHCAAASGDTSRPLEVQNRDDFGKVLCPKIHGTLVLDKLLAERETDFFVLFSSVASLWGGAGGGDYAAANTFMDAFSAQRNMRGQTTLAINWYAWEGLTGPGCMDYMPVPDALAAFHMSLSCPLDQVSIGKFDTQKLREWAPMMKIQLAPDMLTDRHRAVPQSTKEVGAPSFVKPNRLVTDVKVSLKGKPTEPYTELEQQIAQIWAEVLGYEEIDVSQHFFEIGGDSLLILKVLSLLNERVDPEVEAGDLFSYGTVSQLAQFIESRLAASTREVITEGPQSSVKASDLDHADEDLRSLIKRVKEDAISVDEAMKGYESI
ncbi:amino acid adenylation domain-containing protein [Paenibacillus polymyxa]|uniref:amino acid adenylation domain-containing protein n=1 Tax=Paenibacillus polymyxa TaxID=1406 RepID=UPI0025B6847E|nr:amino acid adenylation domain-containing protein [Paenibacillus polymyxa]MDN4076638.1 amino acid adenylation domain-containing protein [Paenibacillus polymyxa]MDN4102064.1 amino acid adenylation domain-containing protein [Paenibacillus polymyxa]MDN4112282.1 amino acid adenylation domain-containing protein [Paenibacillus polymyxa]